MASGTAPFPGVNATSGAASRAPMSTSTGNAGGPVYITSVVSVVPNPVNTGSPATGGAGAGAGASGVKGSGPPNSNSPIQTGGLGNQPGASGAGAVCGPSTVTVTNANTVTVTVTAGSGAGVSAAAASGSLLNGAAGAAGASSSAQSIPLSVYVPTVQSVQSAPFPIGNASVAIGTGAQPVAVPTTSSVLAAPIVQPSSSTIIPPTVQSSPPEKIKAYQPPASSIVAPPVVSSSSAPSAKSSTPSTKSDNVKAKGVAYLTSAQATQISGLGWACNWGQTSTIPNPPFEFIPQLWGKKEGMVGSIAGNCAGAKACLFYNEPDISAGDGGSEIDVGTVISDFTSIMKPIQAAGSMVSTPCVANSNSAYMETFLKAFPSGSVDIMCFHWYGSDLGGLQGTVETFQALATKYGVKELWMNEWAVQPAPSDLSSFTSYLDSKVNRYAYNMNDMAGSTGY